VPFPPNKTKIVATIGPASDDPEILRRLIRAGMNVARLNFSHGDFSGHAGTIARVRAAAEAAGRRVASMADLPGPRGARCAGGRRDVHLDAGRPARLAAARVGQLPPTARRGPAGRPAVPQRRLHRHGSRPRQRPRSDLPRAGGRGAALPQGPQPAWNRPRDQRLHRSRPQLPRVRRATRRRRRQPVLRRPARGPLGRARRGGRPGVPSHGPRQDRTRRCPRTHRGARGGSPASGASRSSPPPRCWSP